MKFTVFDIKFKQENLFEYTRMKSRRIFEIIAD